MLAFRMFDSRNYSKTAINRVTLLEQTLSQCFMDCFFFFCKVRVFTFSKHLLFLSCGKEESF